MRFGGLSDLTDDRFCITSQLWHWHGHENLSKYILTVFWCFNQNFNLYLIIILYIPLSTILLRCFTFLTYYGGSKMRFKDEVWRSVSFDRCQISCHCQNWQAAALPVRFVAWFRWFVTNCYLVTENGCWEVIYNYY